MSEFLTDSSDIFGGWFNEWRIARVQKLENILSNHRDGVKTVLECGAGFGNVGLHFKSTGAEVTMSDLREECLDEIRKKDGDANVVCINHEKDWSLETKFDLVIHMGLSCHLENWKQDLLCTINSSKKWIVFETAVNKFSNDITFKIENPKYHHEWHGPGTFQGTPTTGSLPSVSAIEGILDQFKLSYTRFDDTDLNVHNLIYTDKCDKPFIFPKNEDGETIEPPFIVDGWDNPAVSGGRKFWMIKKNLITV